MKEIRSNENILASVESRRVEGTGVVFNSESVDLGGFTEIISPNAISEDTLRNSDILFLLDHNRERGVLARSKNGSGSLSVSIDADGVHYAFDAPHTALGDEVLEGLRRGDINKCSFAFTVSEDSWIKRDDGTILRTIDKIDKLYDISVVWSPAYEGTSVNVVDKRGLEELTSSALEVKDNVEVRSEEENRSEEEPKNEQRNLYTQNSNITNNMNKNKFSLIGTINDAINMRSNDFVKNGQIVLPIETRAEGDTPAATGTPVANGIIAGEGAPQGGQTVDNQLWDLMTDLKDKMILNDLGVQFITADSTIEIPRYSAGQAGWAGEIEAAKNASGEFSSIKLAPMRLAAYIDISNTWLNMTSCNAESILRQELVNCIALKLQQTILGNGKGDDKTPVGMLYNVTADTAAFKYDDVVDMEAALESANVYSENIRYAVNPKAKAVLRTVKRDSGSGLFVWEKNQIECIDAYSSNSLSEKAIILGDWSQMLVCFFGGNVRMTVDTISKAVENMTRIVVSLDVNYCVKRPEAFVKRILK